MGSRWREVVSSRVCMAAMGCNGLTYRGVGSCHQCGRPPFRVHGRRTMLRTITALAPHISSARSRARAITALLGESNDAFIVKDACTACGLSMSPWVDLPQLSAGSKKTTATFFGCNCSGWVVAFAKHYGLSRSPPYHYEIDKPRLSWGRHPANPFHIPSVPVDFTARLSRPPLS